MSQKLQHTFKYYRINGINIHVDHYPSLIKNNKNKSMIFIHGFSSNPEKYDLIIKVYNKRGYDVYAPNLIGQGLSGGIRGSSSVDDNLSMLKQLIIELGFSSTKLATIVAHSYGCLLSYRFAQLYSNYIEKLILLAPFFSPGAKAFDIIGYRFNQLPLFIVKLIDYIAQTIIPQYFMIYSPVEWTDASANPIDISVTLSDATIPLYTPLYSSFNAFVHQIQARSYEIPKDIPVIIVQGDNDLIIDPESAILIAKKLGSKFMKSNVKDWESVIDNTITFNKSTCVIIKNGSHRFWDDLTPIGNDYD